MTLYDEMMQGVIDIHCHIDFEFSAKERKREPEFLWLSKAEAMGMFMLRSSPYIRKTSTGLATSNPPPKMGVA